jgi:spermine/spermidine synthase
MAMSDRLTQLWRSAAFNVPRGQSGDWRVTRSAVTHKEAMLNRRQAEIFGGPLRYTPEGYYTALVKDPVSSLEGEIWMADTPDEREDHREVFEQCERRGGRILIHGLGLGLITYAVLSLENVEHVDVVEIDEDVLKLVAPSFNGPRVTIHHGDCFTYEWPNDARWTVVWHDIWLPMLETNLAEMDRLEARFAGYCDWQGSWGREWILQDRDRRQRNGGLTGVDAAAQASYRPD